MLKVNYQMAKISHVEDLAENIHPCKVGHVCVNMYDDQNL